MADQLLKVRENAQRLDEAKTPSMIDFHFKKGNENDAEKFVDYLKKDKRKLGVKEIILRPFGAKSGGKSTGSSVSIRLGITGEIETLHKTLDKMKNRFKFNSSVKVDSSGLQTEEVELDEMKKASVEFDRRNKSDMMKAKKDLEKKGHKVDVSTTLTTNTLVVTAKRGSDIGREIKDVMNFYNGAKRAKALESVEEETLDEGRMKELAMKIAQVYSNMKKDKNMRSFADKFRKDVAKSLESVTRLCCW